MAVIAAMVLVLMSFSFRRVVRSLKVCTLSCVMSTLSYKRPMSKLRTTGAS